MCYPIPTLPLKQHAQPLSPEALCEEGSARGAHHVQEQHVTDAVALLGPHTPPPNSCMWWNPIAYRVVQFKYRYGRHNFPLDQS
jgi:hypothetical protein